MRFRGAAVERILPAILTGILTIGAALLLALGAAEPATPPAG